MMKWGFTLRNKLKMALLLFVVFAGLLAWNVVDKWQAAELGVSFNSVYKDRLLVEGYIYELSNCLHAKKELIDRAVSSDETASPVKELEEQDRKIANLLTAYERTKLTPEEAGVFAALKRRLRQLDRLERSWLQYGYAANDLKTEMNTVIRNASGDLHQLSSIQIAVGRDMNDQSQKILSESSVFSQLAIVLLIVVGLVIQILIFHPNDDEITKVPHVRLN
jgi:hypothetical protein